MAKQIDLKEVLLSRMGDIEPSKEYKKAIEKAEKNIPANLMYDAESNFKPETIVTGTVGIRPLSIAEAKDFDEKITECIDQLFQESIHYGVVTGIRTKFLFKAGAEVVINLLGLVPRTEIIDKVEDYANGYFSYMCKTWLIDGSGAVRSEGLAICNSKENKYLKSNPYNVQNILVKICKKRSVIDAVLGVGTLSNRFSQDEDLVEPVTAGKNTDELRQPQKAKTDKPVTQKQLQYLERLMAEHNTSADAINKYVQTNYGAEDYKKITGAQASALIEKFKSIE